MLKDRQQPRYLTEGAVREIVETTLRTAIGQQARQLEKHLSDINKRLKKLEKRG
jgi:hypothetical protein